MLPYCVPHQTGRPGNLKYSNEYKYKYSVRPVHQTSQVCLLSSTWCQRRNRQHSVMLYSLPLLLLFPTCPVCTALRADGWKRVPLWHPHPVGAIQAFHVIPNMRHISPQDAPGGTKPPRAAQSRSPCPRGRHGPPGPLWRGPQPGKRPARQPGRRFRRRWQPAAC